MTIRGIKPKKEYDWARQTDGNYKIYDVEWFNFFRKEHQVGKKKVVVDVGPDKVNVILQKFSELTARGHYPRAFEGHHEKFSRENRPGLGFLDNLKYDGYETFLGDIVDITPEKFRLFQQGDLAYRSIELDPVTLEILGLAFLRSRSPECLLPIMRLKESPIDFSMQEAVQMQRRISLILQKDYIMEKEEEKEKEKGVEESPPAQNQGGQDSSPTDESTGPSVTDKLFSLLETKIDNLASAVQVLVNTLTSKKENQLSANNPEPVAMQSDDTNAMNFQKMVENKFESFSNQFSEIRTQLAQTLSARSASVLETALRQVCDDNALVFENELKQMNTFSGEKNKQAYIDLRKDELQFGRHPMSAFPNQVGMDPVGESSHIEEKYRGKEQFLARQAITHYRDSVNLAKNPEALDFQKSWPEMESFVDCMIGEERYKPGYMQKFLVNRR